MNDPSLLQVLVGASRLPADGHRSTLIVEAEDEHLEALRLQLSRAQGSLPVLIRHAVLAATPDAVLTWFRYNDKRMNGVLPLERWQIEYPNIQLDCQETCQAKTLAQILGGWPAACDGEQGIELTISQGDPIEVLNGAGEWLQRIQRIKIESPQAKTLWLEACDAWLQQRGFRMDPEVPLSWNLDQTATEMIRTQAENNNLYQQLQADKELHAKREEELLVALQHVFPYSAYREKRPDLAQYKDSGLVNHFVAHGISEDVDLHFDSVLNEVQSLREERAEEAAKLELLENKTRQTAQQLELLKDLFARLMVNARAK